MSETLDASNQDNNKNEKSSNIELIYGYTESLIKTQEESLNRLDTKLSAFLAFAGVSLKFAVDLPDKSALVHIPMMLANASLLLKISACFFSVASIVVSVLGLTAKMRGFVVSPKVLMSDKWYWEEPQRCRAYIVNTWIETEKEYKITGKKKGKRLNLAIWLICGAAMTFASDVVLLSFYR